MMAHRSHPARGMRLLAAALILTAALLTLGATAQTACAKDYLFGVTVDETGYPTGKGVAVLGVESGKVTYKKKTGTLTLQNVQMAATSDKRSGVVAVDKDLKIKLVGKNVIAGPKQSNWMSSGISYAYGLSSTRPNVTILGTGSLTFKRHSSGIEVGNNLVVKGGTLTLNSGQVSVMKNLTMRGGKLVVKGEDITVHKKMTVNGGSVTVAKPESNGIEANTFSLVNGTVKITKPKHGIVADTTISGGNLTIVEPKLSAVRASGGNVSIKGGTVRITAAHDAALEAFSKTVDGKVIDGGISITGGKVTLQRALSSDGEYGVLVAGRWIKNKPACLVNCLGYAGGLVFKVDGISYTGVAPNNKCVVVSSGTAAVPANVTYAGVTYNVYLTEGSIFVEDGRFYQVVDLGAGAAHAEAEFLGPDGKAPMGEVARQVWIEPNDIARDIIVSNRVGFVFAAQDGEEYRITNRTEDCCEPVIRDEEADQAHVTRVLFDGIWFKVSPYYD